jgi:hypothetical protein
VTSVITLTSEYGENMIQTLRSNMQVNQPAYQISEMDMGPEHAGDGMAGVFGPTLLTFLGNIMYGLSEIFLGIYESPFSDQFYAVIFPVGVPGQKTPTFEGKTNPQQEVKDNPNHIINETESTSGSPKGSNSYGDGAPIVVSTRVQGGNEGVQENKVVASSAVTSSAEVGGELATQLKKLVNTNPAQGVYDILTRPAIYMAAYHKMKSKPGNITPGVDIETTRETLDNISLKKIEQITNKIKDQSFKFRPIRRIFIPKPHSTKMLPLGIPSPMDKLVQEAMRIVLEAIFEPQFLNCSHGFRPGRGCHSALRQTST